ncbi:MAG: hypothetical protein JO182_16535 [Acidobacteriaceae bacterium]|nr:hypothetical protein [Acidobacteriaceae bacterium]MBV9036097.1 hypothetical protein [Acidobacteriaceae bacterium]MBV9307393.1 hypothetical protein [Acidobacteriaceae bacterium]
MISPRIKFAIGTLALSLLSAIPGCAVPVGQLTFNELQIGEQALNFYNGGFGSQGTGPGPNDGISFTPDFVTVEGGVIFPDFNRLQSERLTNASGIMNISGGYSGLFSFYYTASQSASAQLFSGPNGTGNVVSTLSLSAASIWTPAGGGVSPFQSVVFTGTGLAVDNITFGDIVVPEPITTTLLFTGSVFLFTLAGFKRLRISCNRGRLTRPANAWLR